MTHAASESLHQSIEYVKGCCVYLYCLLLDVNPSYEKIPVWAVLNTICKPKAIEK